MGVDIVNTPWINYKVMHEITSNQAHEKKFTICYSLNENGKTASNKNTKKKRKDFCSCRMHYLSKQDCFLGYPLDWVYHLYTNDWCCNSNYDEQCWKEHDTLTSNNLCIENDKNKHNTHPHSCDNFHTVKSGDSERNIQALSYDDIMVDTCLDNEEFHLDDLPIETRIDVEGYEQKTNIQQDNHEKDKTADTNNESHSPVTKQWDEPHLATKTDQNNEADFQTKRLEDVEKQQQENNFHFSDPLPPYDNIVEAKLAHETDENGVEIDCSDFHTVRQWKEAKAQDDIEISSKTDSNLIDFQDYINNELTLTDFTPDDERNKNIIESEQRIDLDNQVPLTFVNEDELGETIDEKQQINTKDNLGKDEEPFKQSAREPSESNQSLKEMRPPFSENISQKEQITHNNNKSESKRVNKSKNIFSEQIEEHPSKISTNEQEDINQINDGAKRQCSGDVSLIRKKIPFSFFADIKQFLHPPIFGSTDQQLYAFTHPKNNLSPDLKTKLFQTMISYTNQPYCKLINANIHELIFSHHQGSTNNKKKNNLLQQPIVTPLFSPFDSNKKSCNYRVKIPVVLGEYNLEVCLEEETTFPKKIIEIKQIFNEVLLTGCKFVPNNLSFINHGRMTTTEGKLFLQGYLLQHIEYVSSNHHMPTEKKRKHEATHLGQKIVLNFVIELIQIQQILI